jgi:GNAT superfamily N-acetyltransferase
MAVDWRLTGITGALAKRQFDCGDEDLNQYFRRFAHRNNKKRIAVTFVATDPEDASRVLGYFSLCPAQIKHGDAPDEFKALFPRYPITGYRLARLATAQELHGQGLGSQLLIAAGKQALKSAEIIGGCLLFIDAKDADAADWYKRRGATPLPDNPLQLVIPLQWFADRPGIASLASDATAKVATGG